MRKLCATKSGLSSVAILVGLLDRSKSCSRAALFFTLVGCGAEPEVHSTSATDALLNGASVDTEDFPSAVALVADSGQAFCSGTLIATDLVLTAAHCVVAAEEWLASGDLIEPYVTSERLPANARGEAKVAIAGFAAHPDYLDGDDAADIGLVFLATEAPFPIAFLVDENEAGWIRAGRPLTAVGWGLTNADNDLSGGTKHAGGALLTGVTGRQVAFGTATDPRTGERVNCAHGDSGGPVYLDVVGQAGPRVIALITEGVSYVVSMAVRVDAHRNWLVETAAAACGAERPACTEGSLPAPPHHLVTAPSGGWMPTGTNDEIAKLCASSECDPLSPDDCQLLARTPYWSFAGVGCGDATDALADLEGCRREHCYYAFVGEDCFDQLADLEAALSGCTFDLTPIAVAEEIDVDAATGPPPPDGCSSSTTSTTAALACLALARVRRRRSFACLLRGAGPHGAGRDVAADTRA